jgi:hypothetical protein
MQRLTLFCLILILGLLLPVSQTPAQEREKPSGTADKVDVDPLALKVLKATMEPIRTARNYSFQTRVMRENLGTNGQIITYFTSSEVIVSRPDKLRVNFKGRGRDVQLFYNAGRAVLYAPDKNLYATAAVPKTLDAMLDAIEKRAVYLPAKNFIESDPYQELAPDLKTGYVIGKVELDEPVHQLAFTEDNAEWQLWVTGGSYPQVRKLAVIDKARSREPRVVVEFSNWNFNRSVQPDMFEFKTPPGAKQIELSELRSHKQDTAR